MTTMHHCAGRAGSIFVALAASAAASSPAVATPVLIVSQYVQMDPQSQTAIFHLLFSGTPDFSIVDSIGRQENSFYLSVDSDFNGSTGYPGLGQGTDAYIDGGQIYLTGGLGVQLWDSNTHHFGPVIDTLPLDQNGPQVQVTVPWSDLAYTGGDLRYGVQLNHFGAFTQYLPGSTVPLPTSAGLATLGMVGLAARRSRRPR